MRSKRIKAFLMAVVMTITFLPLVPLPAKASATEAEIYFESNKMEATVVTGRTVDIITSVPNNYQNQKLIARNESTDNDIKGIEFTKDSDTLSKMTIDEDFNPTSGDTTGGGPGTDSSGHYSIQGRYNFIGNTGRISWKDKGQAAGGNSGTVILGNSAAIQQDSSCQIECTEAEGPAESETPKFELKNPTGFFKEYEGGKIDTGVVTKDPKKPKEIKLVLFKPGANGNDGSQTYTLTLRPDNMVYNEQAVDTSGNPVVDENNNPVMELNNRVKEGATFDIYLELPRSNPLMMEVLTPMAAVKRVHEQIAGNSGSNGFIETNFIQLAEGDIFSEVSANLQVRTKSVQFSGAEFAIEWEWKPTEIRNESGGWDPITTATKEQLDVLKLGNANEKDNKWKVMNVKPLKYDIKGELIATVTYYDINGKPVKEASATLDKPSKMITVLGKGTVPDVIPKSQKIANKNNDGSSEEFQAGTTLPGALAMDANDTIIDKVNIQPKDPYEYRVTLSMGAQNSRSKFATVSLTGDTDAVTLYTEGSGNPEEYKPGAQIPNPSVTEVGSEPGKVDLIIRANRQPADTPPKRVQLTVAYTRWNQNTPNQKTFTIDLEVKDSSPSTDSSLVSLGIKGYKEEKTSFFALTKNGEDISFDAFRPDVLRYTGPGGMVHVPYRYKEITLVPTQKDTRGLAGITYSVYDTNHNPKDPHAENTEVKNGKETEQIALEEKEIVQVEVTATAPHPDYHTTYTLEITRDSPSEDDALGSLGLYFEDDTDSKNNLITGFDPEQTEYEISVPYSTKRLRVAAATRNEQAEGPTFEPELEKKGGIVTGKKEWLENLKQKFKDGDGVTTLKISVKSEKVAADGGEAKEYTVKINQLPPNDDPTLKGIEITNTKDQKVNYVPAFKADIMSYSVDIPYTDGKIKLNILPNDVNVNNIIVYDAQDGDGKVENDKILFSMEEGKGDSLRPGYPTKPCEVLPVNHKDIASMGNHPLIIRVYAEDEITYMDYELLVYRAEPSDDASIKTMILRDQTGADIKSFAFHPDELEYTLEVPFEVEGISFTPTTSDANAIMYLKQSLLDEILKGDQLTSGMTSRVYKLDKPGEVKEFKIEVQAEDRQTNDPPTSRTYIIKVKRGLPSSDALLKNLQAANIDDGLKPQFLATKKDYSAMVSEGAQGVTITATANHPGATIKINGNVATSGQPSELIELIEVEKTIEIEVTAQDGTTKNLYRIKFTNQNLIEKTSNADLKQLIVDYGQMTPNFQSAVTEYEVAVTEKTYSVDIIPQPADPLAEVKVFSGSKEIGDYGGNYAQALVDGQNDITVKVTSPDKTVTKDYTLAIFRNEEDQLKNLKPLEASDIDFENSGDVILVMIDEYPRVGASVFNELKKYPEKTIIFQGNDYSLKFNAADLTKVIPQAEIYDFRMSFTSPDKEAIYDIIDSRTRNDDIINRTVMMYFWYHGSLPGPATLNVSLGSKYASDTLYWHYYNQERDRIDYYGYLRSNNKGTIAVTVDHFSTYILTPKHRIAGSEDKQGVIDELGQSNGSSLNSSNKTHPYTGAQEGKS